jgi:hypothetical protein
MYNMLTPTGEPSIDLPIMVAMMLMKDIILAVLAAYLVDRWRSRRGGPGTAP